jgi:hypothetical protein
MLRAILGASRALVNTWVGHESGMPLLVFRCLAYYVSQHLQGGLDVGSDAIGPDTVRTLAKVAGIDIPEEDLKPLAAALAQHLASIETLPTVEIADVEPPLVFRVTWDE